MGKIIVPGGRDSDGLALFLTNGLKYFLQRQPADDNPAFGKLRSHLHDPNTLVHATHAGDNFFELAAFTTQPDGRITHECFYIPCDANLQVEDVYEISPHTLTKPSQTFILDSGLNTFIQSLPSSEGKVKGLQAHLTQGGERYITDIREDNTLELIAFGKGADGDIQARAFQISFDESLNMDSIKPIPSSALSVQSRESANEIAKRLSEEGPMLSSDTLPKV